MKKLELKQLEKITGGTCNPRDQVAIASMFGSLVGGAVGGFVYGTFVYYAQGGGSRCI